MKTTQLSIELEDGQIFHYHVNLNQDTKLSTIRQIVTSCLHKDNKKENWKNNKIMITMERG